MSDDDSSGCGGCLVFILFVLLVIALTFGVTIGGRHYDAGCECEEGRGIVLEEASQESVPPDASHRGAEHQGDVDGDVGTIRIVGGS